MRKMTLVFCILMLNSWAWVLSLWIRYGLIPPVELLPLIISDIEFLGPYAMIIDVVGVLGIYLVVTPYIHRRREAKEDASLHEPLDNKTDN